MDLIVLCIGMLLSFIAGSYITCRAYQHKSPLMFIPESDDIPEPISPHEELMKRKKVYVNE